jgi:hypothetical protein
MRFRNSSDDNNVPVELPVVSDRDRNGKHISESGSLLILTSIFMTVMLSFGLITVNVVTDEIVEAKMDSNSIQAEYIAEAGLERAMRELKNTWNATQDWSDVLDGPDDTTSTSDDGELSFGRPVTFNSGNYSVVVTDNDDGDSDLFTDSDGTVVIASVGTALDGTSKTIQAEVSAAAFEPGATIYLDGISEIESTSDQFALSGDDYNIGAITPTTVGAYYGVSSSGSTLTVDDQYKDNITGKDYDSLPEPDVPSLKAAVSDQDVQALIDFYSPYADYVLAPGTYNQSYGTSTNYVIVHVTGDATFNGNNDSYGLLIGDGNLTIKGKHNWTGVVIAADTLTISGTGVEDDVKIYGAAYVGNSSGSDAAYELKMKGKSRVYYSTEAVEKLNENIPVKVSLRINYWKVQ